MLLDSLIILGYFAVVFFLGVTSRSKKTETADEYFLKSKSLNWWSVAASTIATNIHSGHFLGMTGAAYAIGLAQANLEINAIEGILISTFFFVPLYLRLKVTTITQFFEGKFGPQVALVFSIFTMILYAFLYLGTTLFWGAYAVNAIFGEALGFISSDPMTRIFVISCSLGVFSAIYTYLGGMAAVVRTDIIQFVLLVVGGVILTVLALDRLGGIGMLFEKTGHMMHLHLPADHNIMPWPALLGMLMLNLNYWGVNQVILQRALAAKDLRQAQIGLLVGGFFKYVMAIIIIIPGVALIGILSEQPLTDPDMAYPTLIQMLLPAGLRGLILCGLFASLMSSVDSMFHSVSTLWTIDIYKRHLRPKATDAEMVGMARWVIVLTLAAGIIFTWVNSYVKFDNPEFPLTHWFNSMSYYVKNGFVFLILAAVLLVGTSKRLVLGTLVFSIPLTYFFAIQFPKFNYFNRSSVVIALTFLIVAVPTILRNGWPLSFNDLATSAHPRITRLGWLLLLSLIGCHIAFH